MKIYKTPAGANDNINQPNKDDELLEKKNKKNTGQELEFCHG